MVSGAKNEAGNPFVKVDLRRRTTELTKTSLFKSPQDRSFIKSGKILNHIIYPKEMTTFIFMYNFVLSKRIL